jgi:hypothetical protein
MAIAGHRVNKSRVTECGSAATPGDAAQGIKSLFASFSSEKEDSCCFAG